MSMHKEATTARQTRQFVVRTKALRTVLFLDFDDVICLNSLYGGYDARAALDEGRFHSSREMHGKLFDNEAKKFLAAIHAEFHPLYVLSTSWRLLFQHHELVEILNCCGLQFVTEAMHPEWSTPALSGQGLRAAEIKHWLKLHPKYSNWWVVLDDKLSGDGFKMWNTTDRTCIDPAVSAQVRPLMQMLERAFSSSAPGGDADGYRS